MPLSSPNPPCFFKPYFGFKIKPVTPSLNPVTKLNEPSFNPSATLEGCLLDLAFKKSSFWSIAVTADAMPFPTVLVIV